MSDENIVDPKRKLYDIIEEVGEIIIDMVKKQIIEAIDNMEISIEFEEGEDDDIGVD